MMGGTDMEFIEYQVPEIRDDMKKKEFKAAKKSLEKELSKYISSVLSVDIALLEREVNELPSKEIFSEDENEDLLAKYGIPVKGHREFREFFYNSVLFESWYPALVIGKCLGYNDKLLSKSEFKAYRLRHDLMASEFVNIYPLAISGKAPYIANELALWGACSEKFVEAYSKTHQRKGRK